MSSFTIAGIGEALFDVFADGRRLPGGAPFNFSVQAHRIASRAGGCALAVTRIGDDAAGRAFLGALEGSSEGVQIDPRYPTGEVRVTIVDDEPAYQIAEDVAWDHIECDEALAARCDAVCFGTLAQRRRTSRESIQRFVRATRPDALRLFDINLRQSYWDREVIAQSLELANAMKLNHHECLIVKEMFGIHDPMEMLEAFGLEFIAHTRGAEGTTLYTRGGIIEGSPVHYSSDDDADAVGAGDACAAAIAVGYVCRWPLHRVVAAANHAGSYVASHRGALADPFGSEEFRDLVRG